MKYTIISTFFVSFLLLLTVQVGFAQVGSTESPVSDVVSIPVPVTESMPVAQPYEERVENDISFSGTSRCVVNGKEVPCEDVIEGAKTGFKIFGSVILFIVVFGIACFVFWIWMFVHAISKPIQNKVVWIICFILFGIVTAIVYYFAVKRSYVSPVPQAQVAYTPSHTPEVPPSAP